MKSFPLFVVLGSTGFIGSHLYNHLKARGKKVIGFSSKELNLLDKKSTQQILALPKNSILFFTAGLTKEKANEEELLIKNINMALNLAKNLNEKVKRLIYFSTSDVYGISDKLPITEKTPININTYYAISKFTSEKILEQICKQNNISFLVVRFNGIFGNGQTTNKYGPNSFINTIKQESKVYIYGDGKELRDLVYVKDLVKIIYQLALTDYEGIVNIATGKSFSFGEIVSVIKEITSKDFEVVKLKRTGLFFDQKFNNYRLKSILSQINFTPLKQALKEIYYRQ